MNARASRAYVLGPGVEVMPVRELPADVRERIGGSQSDFILSDRTVRAGSQRIDAMTANLLRQFVEPRRIVDAVVVHCRELGLEPSEA